MQRFINHWSHYVPVSKDARKFLLQKAEIISYPAGDHFMWMDERKPYWCMALTGLAFGYTLDAEGNRSIHWFAGPMQGFTGTRHLHTPKGPSQAIQFHADSVIVRIPALHMRAAKKQYSEVSELLHVVHQHNQAQQAHLVTVLQQRTANARFAAFMTYFKNIAEQTTPAEHMDFINMGRGSYYRAKSHYLRNK